MSINRATRARSIVWLSFRVHADALRIDPAAYIKAAIWRLRGLKVRARNRWSALAGRSRHAYSLWILRDEPKVFAEIEVGCRSAPIIPVIDCRDGEAGLDATLASVQRAGGSTRPVLLGGKNAGDLAVAEHPRDLANLMDAEGDSWVCPMFPGDTLAADALAIYWTAARLSPATNIIYSDDDLSDGGGGRREPHFKPDWNPELYAHHDFMTGSSIVRISRDMASSLPGLGWAESLVKAGVGAGGVPLHLPYILHHRISRPEPKVPEISPGTSSSMPSVSVIIPTRNQLSLLQNCLSGLANAQYDGLEIIIVDNGSDDRDVLEYLRQLEASGVTVMRRPGPFNYSALNNAAAQQSNGEFLCFLNNDVEMLEPNWLDFLIRQAVRPELGAIGARLLYPDMSIQHAGVVIGVGGGAGHAHRFEPDGSPGYFRRSRLPQFVTAVTAACMVVAKHKFAAVGGFDEQEFPVAFNDVDLCLKLNAKGWQTFYEPRAALIHHESKSRGPDLATDKRTRFAGELSALKRKWRTDRRRDPFHHPQLSAFCEQFVIQV